LIISSITNGSKPCILSSERQRWKLVHNPSWASNNDKLSLCLRDCVFGSSSFDCVIIFSSVLSSLLVCSFFFRFPLYLFSCSMRQVMCKHFVSALISERLQSKRDWLRLVSTVSTLLSLVHPSKLRGKPLCNKCNSNRSFLWVIGIQSCQLNITLLTIQTR
jgi:uncharacterized membrane protein